MHRHSLAGRHDLEPAPAPRRARPAAHLYDAHLYDAHLYDADLYDADLYDAGSTDLATLRLVLHQHLDDLRHRGVDEGVLRPIEADLRRYDETVEQLVTQQQRLERHQG